MHSLKNTFAANILKTYKENKMRQIIESVIESEILEKIVLSKPLDKSIIKTVCKPFKKDDKLFIQAETFLKDGKAIHLNIAAAESAEKLTEIIMNGYSQADIITISGNCQILISKKGKTHIVNHITAGENKAEIGTHDRHKRHLLDGSEAFLRLLGISDDTGTVIDRRRAKFRQINRFLELVSDIYDKLPCEGVLTVCDLCCGKSYLTFAVYHYLTNMKNRTVKMYGVDLKPDVIEFCTEVADELKYDGLEFIRGDISKFAPPNSPDLIVSLHACDIATDLVLAAGIRQKATVILSTPCCHHEMMNQIKCDELSFITSQLILKQKLCDAATDALRCLRLEIEGYAVNAVELIDPDETPKNVMIRAVRTSEPRPELRKSYDAACRLLGVSPYLDKILES